MASLKRVYVSTAAKTLIGVLAVAFALFALASGGFYLRDRAQNRANVERDLLSNADAIGEELTGWFEGRLLLVRFASHVISQTADRAGRQRALRNETVNRSFEEIFFGDAADGRLVRSRPIDKLPANYDARVRPWYTGAGERRDTIITEPYLSAGDRGMVVTIAVPLFGHGKLLGVTGSDFKLDALTRIMHRHHGARDGAFFLVDEDGKILLHNDRALAGRTLISVFGRPLRPSDTAVREVAQAGVAKLVGFQPIRGLPSARRWYVGVSMDTADANAPLAAVFRRSAITTGIIVIAMLGGFIAILVGIVLRPLKTMTGHIREIAAGRLDATIPHIERADEIGDMARALAIFRDNGREVARLREQDRIRSTREAENRARMMHELQAAFGQVVDAASQGDLHRRVTVDFADAELNVLAASVNMLIATIGRGLDEACDVLSAIAQTDLTRRVEGEYAGAFDAIKRDSNAVADRLSVIVQQLKRASEQLRRGIVDLTAGGRRLADCAAEQSAVVRGTSAEVQVIADIVSRYAADADAASLRAREASAAGEAGGRVMRDASAAMKRMTDASDRVVTIADVLDGIAQQTALVALNAGIEAERAGAAGRTFSVVADEVRHLANHAKAASQDVKETIGAAVEEVAGGARMMAMVEVELMAMLRALNQNSTVLDEIAAASRQQSESIQTIRQSVGRFDAVAQDNLTLVHEIETITGRVETQASELDGIVDVFTLNQAPMAAARIARAA